MQKLYVSLMDEIFEAAEAADKEVLEDESSGTTSAKKMTEQQVGSNKTMQIKFIYWNKLHRDVGCDSFNLKSCLEKMLKSRPMKFKQLHPICRGFLMPGNFLLATESQTKNDFDLEQNIFGQSSFTQWFYFHFSFAVFKIVIYPIRYLREHILLTAVSLNPIGRLISS